MGRADHREDDGRHNVVAMQHELQAKIQYQAARSEEGGGPCVFLCAGWCFSNLIKIDAPADRSAISGSVRRGEG